MRIIAIDGPAASGKSSTAAGVARRLGWAHLDSGALYRALTLAALDNLGDGGGAAEPGWSAAQVIGLAEDLPVRLVLVGDVFRPEVAGVAVEGAIRSERVTQRVSALAAMGPVRRWVNVQQREAALAHPQGVVVDGRDIGTVVFPDAPLKVFLTASAVERARRRLAQRAYGLADAARTPTEAAAGSAKGKAGKGRGRERGRGRATGSRRAKGRRGRGDQRPAADTERRARPGAAPEWPAIDPAELEREAAALAARDRADAARPIAPLRAAADAVLLDTTRLSLEEQVARVVALARERFPD